MNSTEIALYKHRLRDIELAKENLELAHEKWRALIISVPCDHMDPRGKSLIQKEEGRQGEGWYCSLCGEGG